MCICSVNSNFSLPFICLLRDKSASATYYYKSEDRCASAAPSWIKFKVIGLGPGHYPARSKQVSMLNQSIMGSDTDSLTHSMVQDIL
jgi:hypothetical protein